MFKYISRKLLALIGMLLPISAFADSGPFSVGQEDVSAKILNQLFGDLVFGGTNAFSGAISTFNGAVLIVGGILATYTLLAGTLGTAHDGEMLGKKFSSVWIPIRYALGTALVLPVIGNGYCIMQQIVMWCILQGVGLANTVWNSYNPAEVAPAIKLTSAQKRQILIFAEQVAMAQICTQANAAVLNEGGTAGGLVDKAVKAVSTEYKYGAATSADGTKILLGDQSNPIKAGNCGTVTLPRAKDGSIFGLGNNKQVVNANDYGGGKLGNISKAFKVEEPTEIYAIHAAQTQALVTKLGTLANAAVVAKTPLKVSDVESAAKQYSDALEAGVASYTNSNASPFAQIKSQSATQGWILAGAWFTNLATANQKLTDAMGVLPTASYTWQLGSGFSFISSIGPMIGAARAELQQALNEPDATDSQSDDKDDSKGKNSQSTGWWSKIVQGFVSVFTGLDLENLGKSDKPAMLTLQDAGNRMMLVWSISLGVVAPILAFLGIKVFGNGVDAAPLVMTLLTFLFIPISALVALGFTLAYMLPNLPFLMWIGIVLGWIIMCIEAILAAPLWAVMHLHPNGDDLTGRGGNGYMLLLGLLLRPALTIFGLIAALTVTDLMGEFINKIFFSVFISGSGDGLITILSVVFCMSVYTTAMVQLFRKTFSLMHVIPDQLMRWIGGGSEQMGQYAGGLAEAGQKGVQSAAAAGNFMGDRGMQTAGQAIGQFGGLKKAADERRQQNANLERENQSVNRNSKEMADVSNAENRLQQLQAISDKGVGRASMSQVAERSELMASKSNMLQAMKSNDNTIDPRQREIIMKARESGSATIKNPSTGEFQTINWTQETGKNEFDKKAAFESKLKFAVGAGDDPLPPPPPPPSSLAGDNGGGAAGKDGDGGNPPPPGGAIHNFNEGNASLGKATDSTNSAIAGSVNNVAEKNLGISQIQQNQSTDTSTRDKMFNDFLMNNAASTDINGNAINPVAASLMANNVAPTSRGLTQNSAQVIATSSNINSGITKNDTPLSSSTLSSNQFSAEQGSSNLSSSNQSYNQFSADQGSSNVNEQFTLQSSNSFSADQGSSNVNEQFTLQSPNQFSANQGSSNVNEQFTLQSPNSFSADKTSGNLSMPTQNNTSIEKSVTSESSFSSNPFSSEASSGNLNSGFNGSSNNGNND